MSPSDSSHEDSERSPGYSKEIEKPAHKSSSPEFSTSRLQNDIKMLEDGSFSDFDVVCGDTTFKAHKVILSRCPYFATAFSSSSGFKEAIESKITIEEFEPFEVSWLLQYIYGLRIDAEQSKSTSPNKSFLETCALLWGIGDFFLLPDMCQSVRNQSRARCLDLFLEAQDTRQMLARIPFLPELEAGIRAAWRHDRVDNPVQQDLISVCVGIFPFVRQHDSFINLLDEIHGFASKYSKALVGCVGVQSIESHPLGKDKCYTCGEIIFDEYYARGPTSLRLGGRFHDLICSLDCYIEAFGLPPGFVIDPD